VISDDFFTDTPDPRERIKASWGRSVVELLSDKAITPAEVSAGVTPTSYQYPVGHMFRYGIPTDGTSDCTPALNKAIAVAAKVTSGIRFYFPAIGTVYRFTTLPDYINEAMQVYGDGRQTVLYRDFDGGRRGDFQLPNPGRLLCRQGYVDSQRQWQDRWLLN